MDDNEQNPRMSKSERLGYWLAECLYWEGMIQTTANHFNPERQFIQGDLRERMNNFDEGSLVEYFKALKFCQECYEYNVSLFEAGGIYAEFKGEPVFKVEVQI